MNTPLAPIFLAATLAASVAAPASAGDAMEIALAEGCLAGFPGFASAPAVFAEAGLDEVAGSGGARVFENGPMRASVRAGHACSVQDIIREEAAISYLWNALDDLFPGQYSRDRNAEGQMIWSVRPDSGGAMDIRILPLDPAGSRIEIMVVK